MPLPIRDADLVVYEEVMDVVVVSRCQNRESDNEDDDKRVTKQASPRDVLEIIHTLGLFFATHSSDMVMKQLLNFGVSLFKLRVFGWQAKIMKLF